MINRETVWSETFKRDAVYADADRETRIEVFTAIHHYTGLGNISRLDLCSELSIRSKHGPAEFNAEFDLTADQMEELAGYLMAAATRTRHHQALLDADQAESEAASRAAIAEAKEAA